MSFAVRSLRRAAGIAAAGLLLGVSGCGGAPSFMATAPPISVTLLSPIMVSQDGIPVLVQINIHSTSETALVAVVGLPGGVQEKYAASDTSPSGTLAFTGSPAAATGTYSAIVTVNSAGQTASTTFTLVVTAAKG